MLEPTPTTKFKRDLKRYKYHSRIIQDLNAVMGLLMQGKSLEKRCFDHALGGIWHGSRECHVNPDILLIYRAEKDENKLFLERFGSHSELF